jgi:hypothetical protein
VDRPHVLALPASPVEARLRRLGYRPGYPPHLRATAAAVDRHFARLWKCAKCKRRGLHSGELDHGRLAVLADALEEAGCDNQEMLTHLRGPGPHVRGCWVVDVLLGKA